MIRQAERYIDSISGGSKAIKNVREMVLNYSSEEEPILLIGEAGVGKNHIAELIHQLSGKKGQFIVVHTSSIPEDLLESDIFGCINGAFTGVDGGRKGLLNFAEGGTIFFDEITEVPNYLQAKLLQLIDTKKYRMLGSLKEEKANMRVIAATTRNLKEEIAAKRFREDLYYRLSVLTIEIPPLRKRKEDIRHIVTENIKYLKGKKLNSEFWDLLYKYEWPGNVRELIYVIKRAGIQLNESVIGKEIINIIQPGLRNNRSYINCIKEQIWSKLKSGESFWEVVKRPFLDRELKRDEVRDIISKGLIEVGGKYKNLLGVFNIKEKEYKNFMRFLYDNRLK